MPKILILDKIGFGAHPGGWLLDEHGAVRDVPGWTRDDAVEIQSAMRVVREGHHLKTPGLAEATAKAVLEPTHRKITAGLGGQGTTIVLGGEVDDPITIITIHPDGTVTIREVPSGFNGNFVDALHAVNIVRYGVQLSAPELVEATTNAVTDFLLKEVATRFADADVVVFG